MTSVYQYISQPSAEIQCSIPQRFEKTVCLYPENIAVKSSSRELTYDALNRAANRLAHTLLRFLGTTSEPIALLFGHDVEQFIGILGVLKAGKFYVPLDPTASQTRNADIIADTQTQLIVTDEQHFQVATALTTSLTATFIIDRVINDESDENPLLKISPMAYAYIIYTSGTSGKPKGVIGRHREMLHYALTKSSIDVNSQDRVLMLSKYFFSGSLGQIFRTLLNGGAVYPYDVQMQGINGLVRWIKDNEITFYESVPTLFRQMITTLKPDEVLKSVRIFGTGGEGVLWTDLALFKKHFVPGCLMGNGYGLTEVKIVTRYFLDHNTEVGLESMPVGYPVPDTEVIILGEQGEQLGFNEVGEIAVISRYMAPGYWHRPELTALKFKNIPGENDIRMYLTGDLGKLMSDGCLIHMGRNDFQVKIRGNRVELGEIETALLKVDGIMNVAVTARTDRNGETQLVAYIVPRQHPGPSAGELRKSLSKELPSYMLPARYVVLKDLPQTVTGKIDRKVLPEPGWGRPELDNAYVAPRNPRERYLVLLWEDILGIDGVGVYDNFFELGGDSIKIAQLLNRVRDKINPDVFMKSLFDEGTVVELSHHLL